jgi:hypothetical protein
VGVELLIAVLGALVFDFAIRPGLKAIAILYLLGVYLIFSYLAFQNFGRFIDITIPFILVMGHAVFEQVWHWRREARHARAHSPGLIKTGGLT